MGQSLVVLTAVSTWSELLGTVLASHLLWLVHNNESLLIEFSTFFSSEVTLILRIAMSNWELIGPSTAMGVLLR